MNEKSKSELVIVKGQEFKISVKEHIKKEDIFLAQYKQAADMLETIIRESKKDDVEQPWQKTEYENNIIAFCGERGDGKSSAMLTFINAIYHRNAVKNNDEIDLFENCTCTKNSYIAEPIVIDPSQFDDVHNVLDIVLAKMYKKFDEKYRENNQTINEYETQDLLDQFQKVYRQVAMISNQEKLLDDEFDYEGNIGKLAKLGESTNLKKDFGKLIVSYLIYMSGVKEVNHSFVIAIDDLDLCNSAAYKLAEQIRKYLIIPHVVIIMAVKVDQLELAIQEKNANEYKGLMQYSGKTDNMGLGNMLDSEIKNMAERYVSKLIPKARRIYMLENQALENLKIVYKENENGEIVWNSENGTDTLVQSILKLIYVKTGMIFLPEETGMSYLVPDNLRDLINWITELVNMTNIETDKEDDPEENRRKNIEKFYQFFKCDWINRELPYGWEKKFSILENMDAIHTNANAKKMIEPLFDWDADNKAQIDQMFKWHSGERRIELFEIINYFENFNNNIFDMERGKMLYAIKCMYTFKLNLALLGGNLFKPEGYINGYIWGNNFSNTIMSTKGDGAIVVDRSRFKLKTQGEYNVILTYYFNEGKLMDEQDEYISKISDENGNQYIKCWLLLGILSNTYFGNGINTPFIRAFSSSKIIFGNFRLANVEVSLENYLVSLGDVDVLYDKINLGQIGIEREDRDYKEIIKKIRKNNEKSILCAQKIASNIDLAMKLKAYCSKNNDYKSGTDSGFERSEKLAVVFLKNIAEYMTEYVGFKIKLDDLRYFKFDENDTVDICELYARLIEQAVGENEKLAQQYVFNKGSNETQKFREKITTESLDYDKDKIYSVSSFLKIKSAKNAKSNLDNLAKNIQRYRSINKKVPENLKVEELCDYYTQVVQLYLSDENTVLSDEMYEKYKEIAKINYEITK